MASSSSLTPRDAHGPASSSWRRVWNRVVELLGGPGVTYDRALDRRGRLAAEEARAPGASGRPGHAEFASGPAPASVQTDSSAELNQLAARAESLTHDLQRLAKQRNGHAAH